MDYVYAYDDDLYVCMYGIWVASRGGIAWNGSWCIGHWRIDRKYG